VLEPVVYVWQVIARDFIKSPAKINVANDNKTHFPSFDILSHNISRLFSVKCSSASSLSSFIELNDCMSIAGITKAMYVPKH